MKRNVNFRGVPERNSRARYLLAASSLSLAFLCLSVSHVQLHRYNGFHRAQRTLPRPLLVIVAFFIYIYYILHTFNCLTVSTFLRMGDVTALIMSTLQTCKEHFGEFGIVLTSFFFPAKLGYFNSYQPFLMKCRYLFKILALLKGSYYDKTGVVQYRRNIEWN